MNITIIQHDPYVIPGFYLEWAKQHDYHVEVIKCWKKLPSVAMVKDTDLLAVLGRTAKSAHNACRMSLF